MEMIASVTYRHLAQSGDSTEILIEIGRPFPDPQGDWSCSVTLPPAAGGARLVHGIDALQVLCLAVDLVRRELEPYRGTLHWPGVEDPIPLDAYRIGSGFLPP